MRLSILAVSLAMATGVAAQSAQETVTGYVTDTWCGRKGANAKHAEHARRSVASGVAQYAIYDEESKKLYLLDADPSSGSSPDSGQAAIAQYAGQRVKVTGTLSATPLTRAGQSYAPDASAAYIERDPSAASGATSGQANGLRASGATSGTSTAPGIIHTATPTAARATESKVQTHEAALDQTTPIAGTLTISSIAVEPAPPRRVTRQQ